jgi:hypothetical protein
LRFWAFVAVAIIRILARQLCCRVAVCGVRAPGTFVADRRLIASAIVSVLTPVWARWQAVATAAHISRHYGRTVLIFRSWCSIQATVDSVAACWAEINFIALTVPGILAVLAVPILETRLRAVHRVCAHIALVRLIAPAIVGERARIVSIRS